MKVLVTGGAGFIGSAVVRQYICRTEATVINLDKLTYAASLESVAEAAASARYQFVKADICDAPAVAEVFARYRPDAVLHLAAESHVDRSIDGPGAFVATNVIGTYVLLEAARKHWDGLHSEARERFRFLHVSTDEVYGSLGPEGHFIEDTPYRPNSPYSASKAGADHLVRAWYRTYGLPVLITNCSNNFGAYQYPEKLIPLMIMKALSGESLPVYGQGANVRDWLYVEDHAEALRLVLRRGRVGETYNIGRRNERTNIAVVKAVCALLDELLPKSPYRPHAQLITFVADRPGHDLRYAIDPAKIEGELGWAPPHDFDQALRTTVAWYLTNRRWAQAKMVRSGSGARLGLAANLATL